MKKCRITVMRITKYRDLMEMYECPMEEVRQDEEGLQIMRNLARNMVWILRSIEAGKAAGVAVPKQENNYRTNFIR